MGNSISNEVSECRLLDEMKPVATTSFSESLNTLAAFGIALQFPSDQSGLNGNIFEPVLTAISQLVDFEAVGIARFNDEVFDFVLEDCYPPTRFDLLVNELEHAIDTGVFAWALQQNQAQTLPSSIPDQVVLLGIVATRNNTFGVVIGLSRGSVIPEETMKTVSLVLMFAAMHMENMNLNQQVMEHNEILESNVAQRTSELNTAINALKKSLEDANRGALKAESANRAKSQFLAHMSHELRTPLNAIIGMSSLLNESELTADQRELSVTVSSSAGHLLSLINDILDFSKIEAGKLEIDQSPFDIREMLNDLKRMFDVIANQKQVGLEMRIDDDVPSTQKGDEGRLRQVIINLVANAIKFTDKGSVTITVKVAKFLDDGVRLRIAISDTGIGISKSNQERLFTSFTQLEDQSSIRKAKGTGLGLAISKQLVELMGGEIGVESEEGAGATFFFTVLLTNMSAARLEKNDNAPQGQPSSSNEKRDLHASLPSESRTKAENSQQAPSSASSTSNQHLNDAAKQAFKILLAEDNAVNQMVALKVLEKLGFSADVVDNGADAVKAVESKHYDLILMDQNMPILDGLEATRQIRALGNANCNPDVRIVALTGEAVLGARQMFLKAGMDDYLSKPVTPDALSYMLLKQMTICKEGKEISSQA